jgi:hypothetical protein
VLAVRRFGSACKPDIALHCQSSSTCAIIQTMKLLHRRRSFATKLGRNSMSNLPDVITDHLPEHESALLKTVGWVSAGVGALAIGLFVGREIRLRYKFNRRTPYDFYAHSADEQEMDFGLGI